VYSKKEERYTEQSKTGFSHRWDGQYESAVTTSPALYTTAMMLRELAELSCLNWTDGQLPCVSVEARMQLVRVTITILPKQVEKRV